MSAWFILCLLALYVCTLGVRSLVCLHMGCEVVECSLSRYALVFEALPGYAALGAG